MCVPAAAGGPGDLGNGTAEARRRGRLHHAGHSRTCPVPGCAGGWEPRPASRTGAKQASVPSSSSHHSARVLVLTSAAMRSFMAGQAERSFCSGTGPQPSTSSAKPVIAASRRETAARSTRTRCGPRRRSRTPRSTRRRCRGCWYPAPSHMPAARKPWIMAARRAAPSTMAASMTWPWPDRLASSRRAHHPEGQQHAPRHRSRRPG